MISACLVSVDWFDSSMRLRLGRSLRTTAGAWLLCVLLVLLGWATPARAQLTGRIKGTITDPSGAGVPSASVTVRNMETDVLRNATSEADGSYLFLALPVGPYEVKVSKSGFQDSTRGGIELNVNQEVNVDVRLQVSAA